MQPNVTVSVQQPPAPVETIEREEKSPTWFWDMLQNLPRDKWGNVYSVMAWREEPKVPGVPGAKGFLFEAFEPVTLSYFKEKYGGGKFKCVLQENSKFKTTHIFDIEGTPKYDLSREAPQASAHAGNGRGDNDIVREFVTVLRDELQRSREANSAPNPATDEAISLLSKASEKAMDIVAGRANAQGNGNPLDMLTQLTAVIKNLMPAQNGIGDVIVKALVDKMLTPPDPMAQLTTFLSLFEKLDALRGGGGEAGRPKDWRAMLAEGVVQKGPELLKELRATVEVNRDAAKERRAAAETIERVEHIRRAPPGTAVPPPPAPAAAAPATGPLNTVPIDRTPSNGTPPVVQSEPAAEGMSQTESDAVANFMERRIVEMVEDERDPEDVVDFIEEIDPTMNNMLAQFSAEMVTTFLAGRPIIGKATQHPSWNEFLAKAQEYIREIRKEDAEIARASQSVPA